MMRLYWLGFLQLLFIGKALGQCPTKASFYVSFKKIISLESNEKKLPALQQWQQSWKQCYPAADSQYVEACLQTGISHYQNGEFDKAISTTRQVISLYRQRSPFLKHSDLVKAFYLIGAYYNRTDNIAESMRYLQWAILAGKGHESDKGFVAKSHLYLIYAFFVNGDYEKALTHADVGGQLAIEVGDTISAARIWEQRGQVLSDLKRYEEARIAVSTSIRLIQGYPKLGHSLAAQHRLLGTIYQKLGRPDAELSELEKAYALAQTYNHPNLSDFLNSLGNHFYKLRDYRQALGYFRKGLEVDKSEYSKVNLYNRLGLSYARLGNYPEAFRQYQSGFMSMLTDYKSNSPASIPEARRIREIAQKEYLLILIQDKADTWLDWAKAAHNNRIYLQNALKAYMLADTMIDYMRWEHTGQQSKLFWRDKTRPLYERAIETCYRLGDAAQAFRFFEKSRAVLLADKLNELGARKQLAPQQVLQEKQLRATVGDWQAKLAALKPADQAYNQTREMLLSAQDALDAFLKQLEKTNPAYYRYKYDNTTASLEQVQRWLGEQNTSLATYFIGDSALYILGVTPTTTKLIQQPVGNYQPLTASFRQLMAAPQLTKQQYELLLSTGHQLYQYLLAPVGLPNGRVVVSPDGFFLPFEAFSRDPRKSDYLVQHQAFGYTYSANLLMKNSGAVSPTGSFLGMAPVQFRNAMAQYSLPGSEESVQRIGGLFSSPLVLTQTTATRAAFMNQAPANRVIQLYTHADADTTVSDATADEPRLFFADSTLRLSELVDKELFQSELLVLSACKTGIGANQRGEGIFSLARGFASVGIPSIVTTLWSVENQPTYQLTELFHQHLADGLPKDVALQQAKLAFIRQGTKADELPNRWAGLILIGNAKPLPNRWAGWVWLMGLGCMTVFATIVWFNRHNWLGTKK